MNMPCQQEIRIGRLEDHMITHAEGIATLNTKMDSEIKNYKVIGKCQKQ